MAIKITKSGMAEGIAALSALDPDFARAVDVYGVPKPRSRPPGYDSLLKIIVAQQVSTASARAIQGRLNGYADPMTPEVFLSLSEDDHRTIGLSRQKGNYGRAIAEAIVDGHISLRGVARMEDEAAIEKLVTLKGVGRWTAEIYLMFALRRPDLWPADDLGIMMGYQQLKDLPERPNRKQLWEAGEIYRPWRSVAAQMMWHIVNTGRAQNAKM